MLLSRNYGKCLVTRVRRQLPRYLFAVACRRARMDSNEATETQIASVFGKSRVALMKALTIPILELQAALLVARLKNKTQQALTVHVERTFMWTYSTTFLQ